MSVLDHLLSPVLWAVSGVMWAWHQLFGAILGPDTTLSWVLAIVFLVATLRALLLRPALAQLRSSAVLRELAPQLAALRTRHADDPARLLRETSALQKAHGVSPMRTLLSALLQIPVFLGLLHVLEGFHDPTVANHAFAPDQVASFLDARLFGVPLSTYLSAPAQLLTGLGVERWQVAAVAVPLTVLAGIATHLAVRHSVARQPATVLTRSLPWLAPLGVVVSGFVLPFPVGVLLYWLTNNAWTLGQQWWGGRIVAGRQDRSPVRVETPAPQLAPRPGARPAARTRRSRARRRARRRRVVASAGGGVCGARWCTDVARWVMPAELLRCPGLAAAPYAYAAVAPVGSRIVHTAGACPLDEQGAVVAPGDVAGQARQVVVNLVAALAVAGATLADVVCTTVYVASTDRNDLVAAWDVVRAAFGDHDAPSTLLGVAVLGYGGQLVEVSAVAAVGP